MTKTVYPLPRQGSEVGRLPSRVAFSSGVRVSGGDLLFISGHIALNEHNELVGKGDMAAQTRQVLDSIGQVLERAGGSFADIVKVVVYVKTMEHLREIHQVRLEYFPADQLPASTLVEVSDFVHPDALIEIEAMAVIGA